MAIGDQENDIAMIEYAGVGVAMDNAIPVPSKKRQTLSPNPIWKTVWHMLLKNMS